MSGVCADNLFSADPPPRKQQQLLTRRPLFNPLEILHRFLPSNSPADEDSGGGGGGDPYASDYFRMYEFKVRRCTRSRSHDWTDCPFAHPGEKARRRDPRRFHYSGTVCPEFRRAGGCCSRGDDCEFAHGVFEVWLHPARYRTEACKDGRNCRRKVCFFAHTPRQLRVLPSSLDLSPTTAFPKNRRNSPCNCNRCGSASPSPVAAAASPTSTLASVPDLSPPLSPGDARRAGKGFSPASRSDLASYAAVLTELLSSLEGVRINEPTPPGILDANSRKMNVPWIDVPSNGPEEEEEEPERDYVGSPYGAPNHSGSTGDFWAGRCPTKCIGKGDGDGDGGSGCPPDLDWVNDLLR